MGTEQSTTFAYCGRENPYEADIEKQQQTLTTETLKEDNATNQKHKVELLENELRDARYQIKEMFERYAEIKEEYDVKYTKLNGQYDRECNQKLKLMNQIQSSKKRYDELINLINEEHDRELHKYKMLPSATHDEYTINGINKLKESNTILQQQIQKYTKYKDTSISLQNDNDRLKIKLSNLTQIIEKYKQKPNTDDNKTNNIEIIDLKHHNDSLKKQIDHMRDEMGVLKTEYNEYKTGSLLYNNNDQSDIDITEKILNSRQQKQINIAQNEQREKMEQMEKDLANARNEIQALIKTNNEANTNYRTLSEQYQKECEQSSKLMHQLQESRGRFVEMMDSQKLLNEEYERVLGKYKIANMNLQKEMNGYSEYKSVAVSFEKENVILVNVRKELEDEVSKLTHIIAEYKHNEDGDGNNEQNIECIGLKQENERLRNEMERIQDDAKKNKDMIAVLNEQILLLKERGNEEIETNEELIATCAQETIEDNTDVNNNSEGGDRKSPLDSYMDRSDDGVFANFSAIGRLLSIDTNATDAAPLFATYTDTYHDMEQITTPVFEVLTPKPMESIDISDGNDVLNGNYNENDENNENCDNNLEKIDESRPLRNDEKALNELRVYDNMEKAKQVVDVASFVRETYGTVCATAKSTDTECEESSPEDYDDSSYSDAEAIEIAKRKDIAEETEAMKQEIINMKQSMSAEMYKELNIQRHSMRPLEDENEDTEGDERIMPHSSPNLFRYRSKSQWNARIMAQQKKDMTQQMIYLLQSQSKSDDNVIASPKDDEMTQ